MERHVHQLYHFIKQTRLRLHSTHWTNRIIQATVPGPWIVNPLQCIESPFDSFDLLDYHLIDALITECIQRPLIMMTVISVLILINLLFNL